MSITTTEAEAIAARLSQFCDGCGATLSGAELATGERWGQTLCDPCAAGYAAANPTQTQGA